ncbi:MAG: phosphoglucosamine mutase [Clostridia bacterium]|nr:phosphoglucosamine mutase [Clostridia bacterium]
MGKYFGTDGFRGKAGEALNSEHAYKIGRFLGWYFGKKQGRKAKIAIGKDTRLSSYMLEYALASGASSSGAYVYMLHVTTTPSISYVTSSEKLDCGIMISASHNKYSDNGIKIVNSDGEKIDDALIMKIESYIDNEEPTIPFETDEGVGKIIDFFAGRNRYIGYLISSCAHSFKELRIGLDCANGGAHMIAKSVFDALGAKTYVINASPNGININENAGSTHIENLCAYVKRNSLDVAFAFDGDADRCIAVDENGSIVNGDHILYILAKEFKKKGELAKDTVVTTVMSNFALYKELEKENIKYETTSVGDRYVYENMMKNAYSLGGEQSGHIIISKYATTGDGILTAIKLTETMISQKTTLSRLCAPLVMMPQITENVSVANKDAVMSNEAVLKVYDEVKAMLSGNGRVLLRKSGTEDVVRVMAEAESYQKCRECVDKIVNSIVAEGLCCE